ncbi:MBL fold metallo-hydrolase [Candidatus Daviesbacteria bacterium]|nr:MBL fold metallo-hydrolase [Candidatus Daviesbacteria bacterium]
MTVKKYPQSHLVITQGQTKIVIDPGNITFSKGFKAEQFQGADAYLITHQHEDHLGLQTIKEIVGEKPVYGNADVAEKLKNLGVDCTMVNDRQKFVAAGFEIEAVDLPHCKMGDGSGGPPNTGFLINPSTSLRTGGVLFHPGDGDRNPGILSENVALPIAGPSITMEGALKFAQDLKAEIVIPIHYDFFKNDPDEFAKMAQAEGIEVRVLAAGGETII